MATNFSYDFFVGISKVNFTVARSKKNGYDMATIFRGGGFESFWDVATVQKGRGVYAF